MTTSDSVLDRIAHGSLLGDALVVADVAVLLADDTGSYLAVNDRACELTGYSRSELTGLRVGDLGADDGSGRIHANLLEDQLQGRKNVRRRDGTVVACRYLGIRTDVPRRSSFVMLLWECEGPDGAGRAVRDAARSLRDDASALRAQARHQLRRSARIRDATHGETMGRTGYCANRSEFAAPALALEAPPLAL